MQNIDKDIKSPVEELRPLCRKIAAEGSVLLKNDGVLPLNKGTKVALFGRNQETYIKTGTGSGGLVNIVNVDSIVEAIENSGHLTVDNELKQLYQDWIRENPYDNGHGWATEPWCQKEMSVSPELARAMALKNDVAVIIIGRTAGESKDNCNIAGSYLLSDEENELIKNVSESFEKTVVVMNVGNIIDICFAESKKISAVLYVWQGGQEGSYALSDLLCGRISPSGKLPDTQLKSIDSLPFLEDFGNETDLIYKEDIYVGYRYYETFCPDKVLYPFGYGLTYTKFKNEYKATVNNGKITVTAKVTNIGNFTSKEVLEVYFGAPCGKLGTPVKQLIGFAKTKNLAPLESTNVSVVFDIEQMASYDDTGITGNKSCFVMEDGDYRIYAGSDVRSAEEVLVYSLSETKVTKKLEEAMTPSCGFDRIVCALDENGNRTQATSHVPDGSYDLEARIRERRSDGMAYTQDRGIKLCDVYTGKNTLDEFIAQLSDVDLAAIVCGEGMESPKVTPGTGGAMGGVTDSLLDFGIPVCCVTDGPSGLRMSKEFKATSIPSGYVFASSFDTELTEMIFELLGVEMQRYNIDALLGPGMNIHRHPLCGRNFEYFSEDPVLSGKTAAAESRGLNRSGTFATIKHFCANNQEYMRSHTNSIVSERALREIYLKGFEIAVKEGNVRSIMTSYNRVNGYHSASNYDLTTTILRNEWNYQGFVMTDWWSRCNNNNGIGVKDDLKDMVRAHNDIYMVCESATEKENNIIEGLNEGYIVRSDLQICAKNILSFILITPTFKKFFDGGCVRPVFEQIDVSCGEIVCEYKDLCCDNVIKVKTDGKITLVFEVESVTEPLAQNPLTATIDGSINVTIAVNGTEGKSVIQKRRVELSEGEHIISFKFIPELKLKKFSIIR